MFEEVKYFVYHLLLSCSHKHAELIEWSGIYAHRKSDWVIWITELSIPFSSCSPIHCRPTNISEMYWGNIFETSLYWLFTSSFRHEMIKCKEAFCLGSSWCELSFYHSSQFCTYQFPHLGMWMLYCVIHTPINSPGFLIGLFLPKNIHIETMLHFW